VRPAATATTRSVSLTGCGLRRREQLRPAISQIAGSAEALNEERHRPFGAFADTRDPMAAVLAVIALSGDDSCRHTRGSDRGSK